MFLRQERKQPYFCHSNHAVAIEILCNGESKIIIDEFILKYSDRCVVKEIVQTVEKIYGQIVLYLKLLLFLSKIFNHSIIERCKLPID